MLDTLGRLVEYPSVTEDRDANNDAVKDVAEFFADSGLYVARYSFNGYQSMVATTRPGALDSRVMVATHLDVVPAATGATFVPYLVDGKFYGRGGLDMKFNAAAEMEIVRDLVNEGTLHQYDIAFAVTTEEETGGTNGIGRLLDELGYRPKVCVLPDGGDNWQIQTNSKGFDHFVIEAGGVGAHGSRPYEGDNALLKAFEVWQNIKALFPENMGPDTNTISLNQALAEAAINQVPDRARLGFDARFLTIEDMDRIRENMGKICLQYGATITSLAEGVPANFSLQNPYIAPFARLIQEVADIEVIGSHTAGSSDARFFAKHGIPVISLYPTGGGHHGNNEWISEQALYQYKEVLRKYLDLIAKTLPPIIDLATQPAA